MYYKPRSPQLSRSAVLVFIQAALEIIYCLLVLIAAPGFVTSSGTAVIVQVSPWGFLVSGLLAFLVGYGLWTLRSWAFWLVVILEVLDLIGGKIQLFSTYNPWAVLLSMVIPAVILIYFFADRNVREAFNGG